MSARKEREKKGGRKGDNERTGKGTIDFVNAGVIRGGLRNGAARGKGEAKHYGPPSLPPSFA